MPLPVLGAAAIAGGSTLLGSLANILGQSSANRTNVQLQQETNALNYKMFQESQEFARQQQQLAMEYNDPAEQAKRLRAAGINPAGVFGNGSVSEVSQASAPSAPSMVAPQVQPLDYSGVGAAGQFAMQAYFENELKNAQIDKTQQESRIAEVNAQFERAALENKLSIIANDKSKSDSERETARLHLDILRNTEQALVRQEGLRADVLDRQKAELDVRMDGQRIANRIADVDLHWRGKEKSAQYQTFLAKITEAYASARAGDASAAASQAQAALSDAQKEGIRVDNNTKERVQRYVIEKAVQDADVSAQNAAKLYWESKKAKREAREGYAGSKFLPAGMIDYYFGK